MRVLGIGEFNALGDMYWRIARGGGEVRVHVAQAAAHGIFKGLVTRTSDWRAELDWIRAAGDEGVIVFELATGGELQDELRRDGFHVVGGCAAGNRLELDRAFGQAAMRDAGVQVTPTHAFTDFDAALAFVAARPRRYVFKTNDPHAASSRNYVGELDNGADIRALLEIERRRAEARPNFVLMEHVRGVEVGVGAYFNGERFLEPACLDWEHKRFFPGDLGELTGEMGTVVTYRGSERIFARTLGRMAAFLREARYHGYINLNTIANAEGIWPLEFTCRFGYPGFAVCDALHAEGWDAILARMALGRGNFVATQAGYSVGVVLTVPPFPLETGAAERTPAAPVFFRDGIGADDPGLHFAEVGVEDGRLMTAGPQGYLMVATGCGPDVRAAREAAYRLARGVVTPNVRYRNDIGERFLREDHATLRALGYFD
jgi:phosphoribosylamine--glycine ligase